MIRLDDFKRITYIHSISLSLFAKQNKIKKHNYLFSFSPIVKIVVTNLLPYLVLNHRPRINLNSET